MRWLRIPVSILVLLLVSGATLPGEDARPGSTSRSIRRDGDPSALPPPDPSLSIDGDIVMQPASRVFRGPNIFLHVFGSGADQNMGLGEQTLQAISDGTQNLAVGYRALAANTSGYSNVAIGPLALEENTEGQWNVAVGAGALQKQSIGATPDMFIPFGNTAIGHGALGENLGGQLNVAVGAGALLYGQEAHSNVAVGVDALVNAQGFENTAIGLDALEFLTSGYRNIAIGVRAGSNLAKDSEPPEVDRNDNIFIANDGELNDDKTIRIGNNLQEKTFVTGIQEESAPVGVRTQEVCILDTDQLVLCSDFVPSSRRFKEQIQPIGLLGESVQELRPVAFQYKPEFAGVRTGPQLGLLAEEVADVFPDLVGYSVAGAPTSVDYQQLIPLLVSEVQRLQRLLSEQETRLAALER